MEASESQAAQISEGGERSYMVYGKKQSGRPTQQTVQKTKNANHDISTQMTAPVVVCRIAGEMPAPDVAVADTRLMHVSAHKTPSDSIVERPDISAKCVCPTVRMRSHVHVHVCR